VHLDAPHANGSAERLDAKLVAFAHGSRPERASRDCADSAQREGPVDIEPRRSLPSARSGSSVVGGSRECLPKLVETRAGARADGDDPRMREELTRFVEREFERLLVDRVALRHRDHAVLDTEQSQDREVLVRLRPRALRGVDHEQKEIDAGRPGDHRADEALVAGDVDHRYGAAARELEWRVPQVDRDAALALLRQPVGVLAGQCLHERRLAVVDMARSAERERNRRNRVTHAFDFARYARRGEEAGDALTTEPRTCLHDSSSDLVHFGIGKRQAIEQELAVADDSDHGRVVHAQRVRQCLLERAGEAR
jgi:hypothetical protein